MKTPLAVIAILFAANASPIRAESAKSTPQDGKTTGDSKSKPKKNSKKKGQGTPGEGKPTKSTSF